MASFWFPISMFTNTPSPKAPHVLQFALQLSFLGFHLCQDCSLRAKRWFSMKRFPSSKDYMFVLKKIIKLQNSCWTIPKCWENQFLQSEMKKNVYSDRSICNIAVSPKGSFGYQYLTLALCPTFSWSMVAAVSSNLKGFMCFVKNPPPEPRETTENLL